MVHAGNKQGYHGPKGAQAGNCEDAKKGGRAGATHYHKGGRVSKNSRKSRIFFTENLRIIERFLAYDNYPEILKELTKNSFGLPSEKFIDEIKSFVFGEHHTLDLARMPVCIVD